MGREIAPDLQQFFAFFFALQRFSKNDALADPGMTDISMGFVAPAVEPWIFWDQDDYARRHEFIGNPEDCGTDLF
jgi:hypothetical protein